MQSTSVLSLYDITSFLSMLQMLSGIVLQRCDVSANNDDDKMSETMVNNMRIFFTVKLSVC